jgi:hypothetical protein
MNFGAINSSISIILFGKVRVRLIHCFINEFEGIFLSLLSQIALLMTQAG